MYDLKFTFCNIIRCYVRNAIFRVIFVIDFYKNYYAVVRGHRVPIILRLMIYG